MQLGVLGNGAQKIDAVAAALPGVAEVVAVEADDELRAGEWLGIVVAAETDGSIRLARTALGLGHRVLIDGVPTNDHDEWRRLAERASDGLTLSRPLRVDPHLARATDVIRDGTIGAPRTVEIVWSFGGEVDATAAAGELVDVACVLLGSDPAAVYAVACDVPGPALVKINLRTVNGGIAVIEAAGESPDVPTRRDLHVLAADGEIVHRIGQDDLLWSEGRAEPLSGAAGIDELRTRELAAWLDGGDRLARGAALGWNLAATRALARSLEAGEMVAIGDAS